MSLLSWPITLSVITEFPEIALALAPNQILEVWFSSQQDVRNKAQISRSAGLRVISNPPIPPEEKHSTACISYGAREEIKDDATLVNIHSASIVTGTLDWQSIGGAIEPTVRIELDMRTRPEGFNISTFTRSPNGRETFVSVVSSDGKAVELINSKFILRKSALATAIVKDVEGRAVSLDKLHGLRVRIKGTVRVDPRDKSYAVIIPSEISAVPTAAFGGCSMEGPYALTTPDGCELTHPINGKKIQLATFNRNLRDIKLETAFSDPLYFNSGGGQPYGVLRYSFNDIVGSASFAPPNTNLLSVGKIFHISFPSGTLVESQKILLPFAASVANRTCGFFGDRLSFLTAAELNEFGSYLDFSNIIRRDNSLEKNNSFMTTVIGGKFAIVPLNGVITSGYHPPRFVCRVNSKPTVQHVAGTFNEKLIQLKAHATGAKFNRNILKANDFGVLPKSDEEKILKNDTWLAEFNSDPVLNSTQNFEIATRLGGVSRSFVVKDGAVKRRIFGVYARKSPGSYENSSLYFAGIAYEVYKKDPPECRTPLECAVFTPVPFRTNQFMQSTVKGFKTGIVIMKKVGSEWTTLASKWTVEGPFETNPVNNEHYITRFGVTGNDSVTLSFNVRTYNPESQAIGLTVQEVQSSNPITAEGTTGILGDGIPFHNTFEDNGQNDFPDSSVALYSLSVPAAPPPVCVPYATNRIDPHDTNLDGQVTPLDANLVINELSRVNRNVPKPIGKYTKCPTTMYLDVNGDGKVTSLDSLRIINELSRRNRMR